MGGHETYFIQCKHCDHEISHKVYRRSGMITPAEQIRLYSRMISHLRSKHGENLRG